MPSGLEDITPPLFFVKFKLMKKERSIYRAAKRKTTGGFLHRVEEVSATELANAAINATI
ncbi:hypothetical protein SAMN05421741_1521 [Paenimyroides ummariense]|uniref:Uncharacterized protein n=1 Tax=Paenimyroides ummariense TaxID=913024 RepID=A0A1I5GW58_9FLAO|nr:hypothetical protein SAMN05421741_1521 [Paenimyroides ummariense]